MGARKQEFAAEEVFMGHRRFVGKTRSGEALVGAGEEDWPEGTIGVKKLHERIFVCLKKTKVTNTL